MGRLDWRLLQVPLALRFCSEISRAGGLLRFAWQDAGPTTVPFWQIAPSPWPVLPPLRCEACHFEGSQIWLNVFNPREQLAMPLNALFPLLLCVVMKYHATGGCSPFQFSGEETPGMIKEQIQNISKERNRCLRKEAGKWCLWAPSLLRGRETRAWWLEEKEDYPVPNPGAIDLWDSGSFRACWGRVPSVLILCRVCSRGAMWCYSGAPPAFSELQGNLGPGLAQQRLLCCC